jgi:hypothetical protein
MHASAHNVQPFKNTESKTALMLYEILNTTTSQKLLVQNKYLIEFSRPALASWYVTPEDRSVHCKQKEKKLFLPIFPSDYINLGYKIDLFSKQKRKPMQSAARNKLNIIFWRRMVWYLYRWFRVRKGSSWAVHFKLIVLVLQFYYKPLTLMKS